MTRSRPPARPTSRAVCVRMAKDLWPYLDGELAASRRRAVGRHLAACPSCAGTARTLSAVVEACRRAGCGPLPREVEAQARARSRRLLRAHRR